MGEFVVGCVYFTDKIFFLAGLGSDSQHACAVRIRRSEHANICVSCYAPYIHFY